MSLTVTHQCLLENQTQPSSIFAEVDVILLMSTNKKPTITVASEINDDFEITGEKEIDWHPVVAINTAKYLTQILAQATFWKSLVETYSMGNNMGKYSHDNLFSH